MKDPRGTRSVYFRPVLTTMWRPTRWCEFDAFVASLNLAEIGFNRTVAAATGRPGYHPGDMLRLYGSVRLTIKARPRSYTAAMPTARDPLYQRHRFPPEVISHAVWLYFRFPLSLRMVEEMLATRGICVTYETVRRWGRSSARHSPIRSVSARLLAAANGIWMRSSSRSPASHTSSGALSIRTASFSTSWSNVEETPVRRSGS